MSCLPQQSTQKAVYKGSVNTKNSSGRSSSSWHIITTRQPKNSQWHHETSIDPQLWCNSLSGKTQLTIFLGDVFDDKADIANILEELLSHQYLSLRTTTITT
jgi:hypothetical protein